MFHRALKILQQLNIKGVKTSFMSLVFRKVPHIDLVIGLTLVFGLVHCSSAVYAKGHLSLLGGLNSDFCFTFFK